MNFYPIVKNWGKKIRPHLDNPYLQSMLIYDFNKYTVGCWGTRFRRGQLPGDLESCDWRWSVRGRHPEYYNYVKHSACHWLVNFNRMLAELVEPNKAWRIVTSDVHSTVWDGDTTLFDLNGLALFRNADECYRLATFGKNAEVLMPGDFVSTGLPVMRYPLQVKGLRLIPQYHERKAA